MATRNKKAAAAATPMTATPDTTAEASATGDTTDQAGAELEQPATEAQAKVPGHIDPSVGRKVWYWPTEFQCRTGLAAHCDQPCDATVIYVQWNGTVNLRITDHAGNPHVAHGVELLQGVHPERNAPEFEGRASWMPYQAKQAKKAAA